MTETIIIPTDAANRAFEDEELNGHGNRAENPHLPGFNYVEIYGDIRTARSGRYTALFIVTRMSDGKKFGAPFTESADDNWAAENPFRSHDNKTEFSEVIQKTRTITEEYYEIA